MAEMKFDGEVILEILPVIDFLTVIPKEDICNDVEYIREWVTKTKHFKKPVRYEFEKYFDEYLTPIWTQKKLIDMYNYNNKDDQKNDMWVGYHFSNIFLFSEFSELVSVLDHMFWNSLVKSPVN